MRLVSSRDTTHMKLGSCCAILKFDWVQGTLFMALFRISKPLQKHLIITLKCYHDPTVCALNNECRLKKKKKKEEKLTIRVSHSPLFWWIPLKRQPLKLVILKKRKQSIVIRAVLVACQSMSPLQCRKSQPVCLSVITQSAARFTPLEATVRVRLHNHLRGYDQLYAFQYFNQHTVRYSIKWQRRAACTVLWQNGSSASSPASHVVKFHHCTVRHFPALHTFYMKGFLLYGSSL